MKLFGKELFNYKKPAEKMYDFAQHGILNSTGLSFAPQEIYMDGLTNSTEGTKKKKVKKEKEAPKLSPKELYQMKALNDNDFRIQNGSEYLKEQLSDIDNKLSLLGKKPKNKKSNGMIMEAEWGSKKYAREELESIRERLHNRTKLAEFQEIIEKYPHTSSQLIQDLLDAQKHLRVRDAEEFVPDFPRDAINAMKEYEKFCISLCNKKPVFYVIADQKDFQQVAKRRDPILLAQSPFGHFWQILGAWDKEMIFLGDL